MEQQQQISPAEIDGRINMLSQQRNEALDRCALVAGLLAVANERIKALEAQLPDPGGKGATETP